MLMARIRSALVILYSVIGVTILVSGQIALYSLTLQQMAEHTEDHDTPLGLMG